MMNWFYVALRRGTTFAGRAGRKEFGFFHLTVTFITLILIGLDYLLGTYDPNLGYGLISGCFMVFLILCALRLMVHRLHDTNHSGWWTLLIIVPVIDVLVWLYLLLKKGDRGDNEYGKEVEYQEFSH